MGRELRVAIQRRNALSLVEYKEKINELHGQVTNFVKTGMAKAKEIGMLLADAKGQCKHGQFEAWIEANCDFSVQSARSYMRLHEKWEILEEAHGPGRLADMTLTEGLRHIASKEKADKTAANLGFTNHAQTTEVGSKGKRAFGFPPSGEHGGRVAGVSGPDQAEGVAEVSTSSDQQVVGEVDDEAQEIFRESETLYIRLTRNLDRLQGLRPYQEKEGIQVSLSMSYENFLRWKNQEN